MQTQVATQVEGGELWGVDHGHALWRDSCNKVRALIVMPL